MRLRGYEVNVERLTIKGKKTEVNGRTTIRMVVVLCTLLFSCKITFRFLSVQTDKIYRNIDKIYVAAHLLFQPILRK